MNCYCLFCETFKCRKVAIQAQQRLGCRALYPRQVQHIRRQGRTEDVEHDLLPGYVFLYFDQGEMDYSVMRPVEGVLRFLKDQDGNARLQGSDEAFALMLLEKGGVVGKTSVYQEGDRIRLRESAFAGLQAQILKVDKRNMRMQIEIPFASAQIKTWVEYEMVERVQGEEGAAPEEAKK